MNRWSPHYVDMSKLDELDRQLADEARRGATAAEVHADALAIATKTRDLPFCVQMPVVKRIPKIQICPTWDEVEEAQRRLRARLEPDGSVCEHGQTFGCMRCFGDAMAAWCPDSTSDAVFGLDRSPRPSLFTRVDAEHYADMYDVGTEEAA